MTAPDTVSGGDRGLGATVSAATVYCARCGAAEANHNPGGSRFGSCVFLAPKPAMTPDELTAFRALTEEKFAAVLGRVRAYLAAVPTLYETDGDPLPADLIIDTARLWGTDATVTPVNHLLFADLQALAQAIDAAGNEGALADKVRALADEWDRTSVQDHDRPCDDSEDCARCCARDLRALLPTPHEGDSAEVGSDG